MRVFSHTPDDGPLVVVVRVAAAPDNTARVLLQLPDGFVLISAADARRLAARLLNAADDVDNFPVTRERDRDA